MMEAKNLFFRTGVLVLISLGLLFTGCHRTENAQAAKDRSAFDGAAGSHPEISEAAGDRPGMGCSRNDIAQAAGDLPNMVEAKGDQPGMAGANGDLSEPETLLLKDYRPVSIYNVPVTEVARARYPAIDMHAHDYARSAEGVDEWVRTKDEAGIEKTVILCKEHGKKFDSVIYVYSRYPDRFEVWCGFDYSTYEDPGFPEAAVAELVRCFEMGAAGVGELGDKGKGLFYSKPPAWGMHSDDARMDPLWEKCGELGLPVNLHVADPKWMYLPMDRNNDGLMNAYKWRLDNQPDIVDHQGMIDILERTVRKHPNTTFIACHLANCTYDLEIIGELLDKYPNLFIDISARYAEMCAIPRTTRNFIEKYQDRIVYGTDMGRDPGMYRITFRLLETADEHIYSDRFSYHWPLHALDIPDGVLEKIYRLNALKIKERAKTFALRE